VSRPLHLDTYARSTVRSSVILLTCCMAESRHVFRVASGGFGVAAPSLSLRRWKLVSVRLEYWTQVFGVRLSNCIQHNCWMGWWANSSWAYHHFDLRLTNWKSWSRTRYTMWHDVSHDCCFGNGCWSLYAITTWSFVVSFIFWIYSLQNFISG
jgi:hypothetical protein